VSLPWLFDGSALGRSLLIHSILQNPHLKIEMWGTRHPAFQIKRWFAKQLSYELHRIGSGFKRDWSGSLMNLTGVKICFALVLLTGIAPAQTTASAVGCTTEHGSTDCNWYWSRKSLDAAHVVKAEYGNMDRSTGAQLNDLAKQLGKTVAKQDGTADLTFTVTPAAVSGVDVGPADEEILELRVYAGDSSQGKLIWVETYRGQKDKPWPANVHEAIAQFRSRLKA
jgi:hypothetical protein